MLPKLGSFQVACDASSHFGGLRQTLLRPSEFVVIPRSSYHWLWVDLLALLPTSPRELYPLDPHALERHSYFPLQVIVVGPTEPSQIT